MIVAQVINITLIIGKIFNRKLRYLKMMTSSQGHLVEVLGSSSGGGHIGFEGYGAGSNRPGIRPMTGSNMGYAALTLHQYM